ncbi:hypothetical protein [Paenibacillus odorifer]|uniref:hypothetical protein n=1 Tax=Paenibacillus odorifer TaxID=189426 RepID=UPI00096EAF4D|nr:hypothetical protein [Paenibacillus odorifer]OMD76835.1 hypothetical protein BSK50_13870 [Paenibacillus odorifer]
MGEYTGLRCKLKIKDEFVPLIESMVKDRLDWGDLNTEHLFIKDFAEYNRSSFIPYGMLSYMPDEWEEVDHADWNTTFVDKVWTFQCSLKNYEDTIEKFFTDVLPEITEVSLHIETYYNGSGYAYLHKLEDGSVVETGEKIEYRDY